MRRFLRAFNLACAAMLIAIGSLWLSRVTPRVAYGRLERGGEPSQALVRVVELEPAVVDQMYKIVDHTGSRRRRAPGTIKSRVVGLELLSGPHIGRRLAMTNLVHPDPAATIPLDEGDVVRAHINERNGKIDDIWLSLPLLRCRQAPLILAAFLIALLVVGGVRGVRLVVAIVLVGVGTFTLYLPAIARGMSPLAATLGFSLAAVVSTFLLTDRLSRKTVAAFIGVAAPLAIAGLLGIWCVHRLGLTGKQTTSAVLMLEIPGQVVNMQGLLAASMIVLVLGIAIDMAISLASAMDVLYEARPDLRPWAAFKSGMVISGDITGTMLGTMIFAYLGARLSVLFFPQVAGISVAETVNSEPGSIELTRLLVGMIGLLLTGPISVGASVAVNALKARGPAAGVEADRKPRRATLAWLAAVPLAVGLGVLWTGYARWSSRIADALALGRARFPVQQRIATESNPTKLVRMAQDFISAQDYDSAILAAWRARALEPHSAAPHVWLGYAYSYRRWLANALYEFETAVQLEPKNLKALYYAGHTHINLRQYKQAVQLLLRAVCVDPDSVDALCDLATAYTQLHEWNHAEDFALKAYVLAPDDARVLRLINCIGVEPEAMKEANKKIEANKAKQKRQE